MSGEHKISSMDHVQATELFSSYWDRELQADEAARLEEHLGSCVVCRREYQDFEKAVGALGSLGKELAPQGFVQGVVKRVRKRSRGRFFVGRGALERIPYELFSVVMLAILVAIYLVLQLSQPGRLRLP
jgi:anti-sigma factor RsiW